MDRLDRRWMRMPQVTEYTGYSKWTIYGWIKKREFPFVKASQRGLLFDKVEVDKWIEKRAVGFIK